MSNLVGKEKSDLIQKYEQRANYYKSASIGANTKTGYTSDIKHFNKWCEENGESALPASPDTLIRYITCMADQGGYKVSTINRRIVSISKLHKWQGEPSPTTDEHFKEIMKGIKREKGVRQKKVEPLTIDIIREIVKESGNNIKDKRDKALLLFGFAGAFRRSELTALNIEDLQFHSKGVDVLIQRSKTDQEGEGVVIGIPFATNPAFCPVVNLKEWIKHIGKEEGPLFTSILKGGKVKASRLSDYSVAGIVKSRVEDIGHDPDKFSGHSLRAGFITSAYQNGKTEYSIMRQSRHKSVEVFRGYIRDKDLYNDNAASGIM